MFADPPAFAYPWMRIHEDPVHWQLRVFGEHMDRSFDSRPDDRVKFEPDAWQRKVLDKLDRDESVLVVAPTRYASSFSQVKIEIDEYSVRAKHLSPTMR